MSWHPWDLSSQRVFQIRGGPPCSLPQACCPQPCWSCTPQLADSSWGCALAASPGVQPGHQPCCVWPGWGYTPHFAGLARSLLPVSASPAASRWAWLRSPPPSQPLNLASLGSLVQQYLWPSKSDVARPEGPGF